MEDLKDRFAQFSRPMYFSRVDAVHILELYIGLDDKGRKSIELRSLFTPRKVTGTTAIEVNQYAKESHNIMRFSLIDEEISGLFFKFCEDLIEQTRNLRNVEEGYQAIITRFYQWKKMFVSSRANFLSEPEIMGLIGEILFLRENLADRIGLSEALRSWSGQELTHKDFSYQDLWFEVKTVSRGIPTVRISSLEQLDSDHDGELIVFILEKMSSTYKGISLNKLILETRDMFMSGDERDLFMAKTALQGYEYNDFYDDFVYEIVSCTRYSVNGTFPRLTVKNVPSAIRKASYDIALTEIATFEL